VTLEHHAGPVHLRPATDLAERVLLPGDPHRALMVAQDLLDGPLMFNHARGLWGYTGTAADGDPLTIQSTGMGGPSAAIVCEELIALGARRLVRIGTCGALNGSLGLGDLVAAAEALPADGTSVALGAERPVAAEAALVSLLVAAGARAVTVVSTDLFYDERATEMEAWIARGAAAVEMEAATLFRLAELRGVEAACVLGVSDVPGTGGSVRATVEQMDEIGLAVGRAGYEALRAR
jgi:DeoD family purine-nucleoside phosphorylase